MCEYTEVSPNYLSPMEQTSNTALEFLQEYWYLSESQTVQMPRKSRTQNINGVKATPIHIIIQIID